MWQSIAFTMFVVLAGSLGAAIREIDIDWEEVGWVICTMYSEI